MATIYLDCETTGLEPGADEILTLTIVSGDGEVLLDKGFRPESKTEWPEAEAINHISPEDVASCPTISERAAEIQAIVSAADKVVGYNVGFDLEFLAAAGIRPAEGCETHDTMRDFAELYGEPDARHPGEFRWKKLTAAADLIGHEWAGAAHGSLADTLATRAVQGWCDERRAEARGLAVERVVFDEDAYFGEEAEGWAVESIMAQDGLADEAEVREAYTDDEIFRRQMEIRDDDFEEERRGLVAFFDGEKADRFDFVNPHGGNHVLVRGSVGRWDGVSRGISVYEDLEGVLDCSRNRDSVLSDCDIDKISDVNGRLLVEAHHHDAAVSLEIRQLTDAGEKIFSRLDYGEYIPLEGLRAMGRDYQLGDEGGLIRDLWDNPDLCARPRYMEQAYGNPAIEYRGTYDGPDLAGDGAIAVEAGARWVPEDEGFRFTLRGFSLPGEEPYEDEGALLAPLDRWPPVRDIESLEARAETFAAREFCTPLWYQNELFANGPLADQERDAQLALMDAFDQARFESQEKAWSERKERLSADLGEI